MQKSIITITPNAAKYIHTIVQKHASDKAITPGLRVSIKKGGCSGNEYDFSYADAKHPQDEEIIEHDVRVFIDPGALLHIIGSMMDYEDTLFKSGLVFTNPNEEGRCGCGKSVQFSATPKGE